MVVKPFDFIAKDSQGVLQPAVKCRGPEYLRIIYGPEYLLPTNLERLKKRSLGRKRALALREFALGIESLERFSYRSLETEPNIILTLPEACRSYDDYLGALTARYRKVSKKTVQAIEKAGL